MKSTEGLEEKYTEGLEGVLSLPRVTFFNGGGRAGNRTKVFSAVPFRFMTFRRGCGRYGKCADIQRAIQLRLFASCEANRVEYFSIPRSVLRKYGGNHGSSGAGLRPKVVETKYVEALGVLVVPAARHRSWQPSSPNGQATSTSPPHPTSVNLQKI